MGCSSKARNRKKGVKRNSDFDEYLRFVQLWEQLADYFKDEPEQVCFETINEPDFEGESDEGMIVIPTMNTNHEKSEPL